MTEKIKNNLNKLLFFIPYGILIIINLVELSFYGKYISYQVRDFLWHISLLCLSAKELIHLKKTEKELFVGLLLLVLFLLARGEGYYGVNAENVVFLLIFSSRNIENKKIINFTKWLSIIILAFVVVSSQIGIIKDVISEQRNRHYLGFLYTLYGPTVMLHITFLFFISKKNNDKRIEIIKYLVLLIANTWFYHMTSSRLAYYISVMVCVIGIYLVFYEFPFDKKIIKLLWVFSFVFFSCFSVLVACSYDKTNQMHQKINNVFSDRIRLTRKSIEKYGFTLYERDIVWHGEGLNYDGQRNSDAFEYDYVDCMYVREMQRYGMLFYVLAVYLITRTLRIVMKQNDIRFLLMCGFFSVQLLIDDLSRLICFSSLFLLIGTIGVKHYLGKEVNYIE